MESETRIKGLWEAKRGFNDEETRQQQESEEDRA